MSASFSGNGTAQAAAENARRVLHLISDEDAPSRISRKAATDVLSLVNRVELLEEALRRVIETAEDHWRSKQNCGDIARAALAGVAWAASDKEET